MRVEVEAYSGFKANEKPRCFLLAGRSYQVQQVVDQWYSPEATYFKVLAEDENFYILKYDERVEQWSLESFRGSRRGLPTHRPRVPIRDGPLQ